MAQEKTRLKFRVTAHDGVSAGGLPEPRWSEKWGVGLFDYEEFHVTDQLLKLPFQEATPKTVCVFSILDGALAFRMLDDDRRSEVNGVERRDAIVTVGDKIKIGEALTIEVAHAPPKTKAKAAGPAPSLGKQLGDIPKLDPEREEGPTLTFAPTGMTEAAKNAVAAHAGPKRDVPPTPEEPTDPGARMARLKMAALAEAPRPLPDPALPVTPVFEEASKSVEIQEPSLNMSRRPLPRHEPTPVRPMPSGPVPGMAPDAKVEVSHGKGRRDPSSIPARPASLGTAGPVAGMAPEEKVELADPSKKRHVPPRPATLGSPGPVPGLLPEEKVELAKVPHARRDASIEDREDGIERTSDRIEPLYAEEADLTPRPTLAERIMAAIARILRRDDVNPPEEPFPAEEGEAPWVPEGIADPGISRSSDAHYGKTSTQIRAKKEKKKKNVVIAEEETKVDLPRRAWIPEAVSAAARVRGRALVFLVAAIGTLMIAVGVFRIQNRIAEVEANRKVPVVEPMSEFAPHRGIPIQIIEEKVRRMRPTPRGYRR